jgi:hypothetical protein
MRKRGHLFTALTNADTATLRAIIPLLNDSVRSGFHRSCYDGGAWIYPVEDSKLSKVQDAITNYSTFATSARIIGTSTVKNLNPLMTLAATVSNSNPAGVGPRRPVECGLADDGKSY